MNVPKVGEVSVTPASAAGKKETEAKTGAAQPKDTVELTPQAQALYSAAREEKLAQVSQRIASGFYNQRGVIEKVAARIAGDLKGEA